MKMKTQNNLIMISLAILVLAYWAFNAYLCTREPVIEQVKEHQSEYVDYSSVEATQRRRGPMIIE